MKNRLLKLEIRQSADSKSIFAKIEALFDIDLRDSAWTGISGIVGIIGIVIAFISLIVAISKR